MVRYGLTGLFNGNDDCCSYYFVSVNRAECIVGMILIQRGKIKFEIINAEEVAYLSPTKRWGKRFC
jgi:hypothetical protein